MLVQRVAPSGSRVESWTVIGDDDVPVEPVEGQGLGKVVSQQVSRHAMAWSGCLA